jgi:hypothetical protein
MKYHDALNRIRSQTRPYWDRDETRSAVRQAFRKASQCRTPELGAEVYSSKNQELNVAVRQGAPLATLDNALQKAGRAAGIKIFKA